MAKQLDGVTACLDHLLKGMSDRHMVFGPVVWRPSATGRDWYFIVATCGPDGFRSDQILGESAEEADQARAQLAMAAAMRPPVVLHDVDDELYMAKLCEALWPGEQVSRLRATIERERAH